jgi:hypothetical protein
VDVLDGRLVVSGGMEFQNGYVDRAFDHHEDAFLDTAPGNTVATSLPGFDINGIEIDSQLRLEVLPRPDYTRPDAAQRWLWFWDEASGFVGTAESDPNLEIASQRLFGSVLLTQFDPPSTGPTIQVAEPRPDDLGTHQHLLFYLLDNAPPAPAGVYGFFLRLTSPNYMASEPFLVALNRTDPSNFAEGAEHINAAARLPGDFDGDEAVDGDDFLLWERTAASVDDLRADASLDGIVNADDLAVWRVNFGRTAATPVAGAPTAATPEPAAGITAATAAMAAGVLRNRGRRAWARREKCDQDPGR